MVAVPESVERLQQRPWIAHLIRTVERYLNRLGSQFAAATAYFSVLAIVPVLMVAFSITGLVLTVLQPGLLDNVANAVADALGRAEPPRGKRSSNLVNTALSQFWTIGIIGLVVALYTGAKVDGPSEECGADPVATWIRSSASEDQHRTQTLGNLVLLLGLLVGMAVMFGLSSLSTSLANTVVGWLGLGDQPWIAPLLRVSSIVVSIGAGWLIFMYLYTVLPETREPWSVVRRGALLGSIALAVLQYVASYLISAFRGNLAAVIFGPVIVFMLFFNIFAQLVLFIAAWIATAEHEAVPVPAEEEPVTAPRRNAARETWRSRRMWFRRRWQSDRFVLAWAPAMSPERRPESAWAQRSRTCCQRWYAAGKRPDERTCSSCAVSARPWRAAALGWPMPSSNAVNHAARRYRTACRLVSCRTRWPEARRRAPRRVRSAQAHRAAHSRPPGRSWT